MRDIVWGSAPNLDHERGSARAPAPNGALPQTPTTNGAPPRTPLRVLFREKHPETPKNSIRAGKNENGNYN